MQFEDIFYEEIKERNRILYCEKLLIFAALPYYCGNNYIDNIRNREILDYVRENDEQFKNKSDDEINELFYRSRNIEKYELHKHDVIELILQYNKSESGLINDNQNTKLFAYLSNPKSMIDNEIISTILHSDNSILLNIIGKDKIDIKMKLDVYKISRYLPLSENILPNNLEELKFLFEELNKDSSFLHCMMFIPFRYYIFNSLYNNEELENKFIDILLSNTQYYLNVIRENLSALSRVIKNKKIFYKLFNHDNVKVKEISLMFLFHLLEGDEQYKIYNGLTIQQRSFISKNKIKSKKIIDQFIYKVPSLFNYFYPISKLYNLNNEELKNEMDKFDKHLLDDLIENRFYNEINKELLNRIINCDIKYKKMYLKYKL